MTGTCQLPAVNIAAAMLSAVCCLSSLAPLSARAEDAAHANPQLIRVQLAAAAAEHRGGVLRMVAQAAGGTIDPQINYTQQFFQTAGILYDGLVAFKKVSGPDGFTVVPDLAEALPKPQDGGKTYVFKLRQGVKFWDGRDVTVADTVASFRRIFRISGPTAGTFYNGIVGADACLKTPATCTLEGGVAGDEAARTITIHLVQPDAEFFDKLTVPHAAILPADAPAKDGGVNPIPGTGPYKIGAYDPNKQLKLVRNPYFKEWSKDAQPDGYADEIHYDFGLNAEAQVSQVENGQADWMYDQPPNDRLSELGAKYQKQVHITALMAFWYTPMNTNLAPFNNVKVRQAVNYAIDRNSIVKLFGGPNLAAPVCQILPPGFPGHVDFCTYTKNPGTRWKAPDFVKAKKLVSESGTTGQKVTIVVEDTSVSRGIGVYLQSLFTKLGYVPDVKPISPDIHFTFIQNTKNNVQISVSYWYQDYPAASDFLNVMFSCDSFHPASDASVNIAGLCDKDLDARMKAALKTAVTDESAANAAWGEIDKYVMNEQAPVAPLFTPKHVDFVSRRVGNFVFNGQYFWIASQAWIQ
jgi:peptide/nickel transport system substrate-binding protein